MATRVIKFPVAYRQNTNTYSSAYGKFFPIAWRPETLSLRGLIERVAFSQSVYSRDIVEGVITKLTEVMVELLRSGQPVKWDTLGTFTPSLEGTGVSVKTDTDGTKSLSVNPELDIKGVHITFQPESSKGDNLTSRAFKDLCLFETVGIVEPIRVGGDGEDAKKIIGNKLVDITVFNDQLNPSSDGGDTPNP